MANHIDLDPLSAEAINAALEGSWERARELNEDLLKKYPGDIEIMSRLAKALSELGKTTDARKIYKKILKADPYNSIAEKNLHRLSSLRGSNNKEEPRLETSVRGDIFLEEPGKTIVVPLSDTAMTRVLADLQAGDKVELVPHRSDVTVVSPGGNRIGKIDDSLSKIIAENLRAGSRFEAFIKSIVLKPNHSKNEKSSVSVFIREAERSPKIATPPFPINPSAFTPYVREDAMNLISNQTPLPTEVDSEIEEVEVSDLPSTNTETEKDESLEELAEKEAEDDEIEEE